MVSCVAQGLQYIVSCVSQRAGVYLVMGGGGFSLATGVQGAA